MILTVKEVIEALQKCDPNAKVLGFSYDDEQGFAFKYVDPNGANYAGWDKYEVIESNLDRNGGGVVVLTNVKIDPDEWED